MGARAPEAGSEASDAYAARTHAGHDVLVQPPRARPPALRRLRHRRHRQEEAARTPEAPPTQDRGTSTPTTCPRPPDGSSSEPRSSGPRRARSTSPREVKSRDPESRTTSDASKGRPAERPRYRWKPRFESSDPVCHERSTAPSRRRANDIRLTAVAGAYSSPPMSQATANVGQFSPTIRPNPTPKTPASPVGRPPP